MLYIKDKTKGCVTLGAGTLYKTLSKLEKAALIAHTREQDRKKYYVITGGISLCGGIFYFFLFAVEGFFMSIF